MATKNTPGSRATVNWFLALLLLLCGLAALLTGPGARLLPGGGIRGRGVLLPGLLSHGLWSNLHHFAGLLTVGVGLLHLALNWSWVSAALKRWGREMGGKCAPLAGRAATGRLVNLLVAAAAGGVAFFGLPSLILPRGSLAAGLGGWLAGFVGTGAHILAALALAVLVVIHLALHWKWFAATARGFLG